MPLPLGHDASVTSLVVAVVGWLALLCLRRAEAQRLFDRCMAACAERRGACSRFSSFHAKTNPDGRVDRVDAVGDLAGPANATVSDREFEPGLWACAASHERSGSLLHDVLSSAALGLFSLRSRKRVFFLLVHQSLRLAPRVGLAVPPVGSPKPRPHRVRHGLGFLFELCAMVVFDESHVAGDGGKLGRMHRLRDRLWPGTQTVETRGRCAWLLRLRDQFHPVSLPSVPNLFALLRAGAARRALDGTPKKRSAFSDASRLAPCRGLRRRHSPYACSFLD